MIEVEISNEQQLLAIDCKSITSAVSAILTGENIKTGNVSVAVVDGPRIHELNRRWLEHDYTTDVLSFVIEQDESHLEGEIIVSAEMAMSMAAQYDWNAQDELLLYVVHGALHLVGYDDLEPDAQAIMRQREQHYLQLFGLQPKYDNAAAIAPTSEPVANHRDIGG